MLYFCVGDDFGRRKQKVEALLRTLQTKRPEAELLILEGGDPRAQETLQSTISSMGLFDEKTIIKALDLFENKELKSFVLEYSKDLSDSPNAFVFSENKITSIEAKKIAEGGGEIFTFETTESKAQISLFYLGDLLLQKNKSKLWTSLQEELRRGVSIEEIFGILMWQSKSLHLAKKYNQKESTLQPFVYSKCSKADWSSEEARDLHFKLVEIYHEARRGGLPTTERIEQLILNL